MKFYSILSASAQAVFLGLFCRRTDSTFNMAPFQWEAMVDLYNASDYSFQISSWAENNVAKPFASEVLKGQPLYMSLTTIRSRIYGITGTIQSIISGTVWPDHIYIFVSRDPHLLDLGVTPEFILSESKGKLREIAQLYPWISVIFTENIGPHRKLLPLLAKKWDEDCAIVTIDDHETYRKTTLESLIKYYDASDRNAVVALRARRMGICSDAPPWRVSPYTKNRKGLWPEASPALREMLILPTGTGGVLYRPRFFHPVVFDRMLMNLTLTGDDLMFRLATLAMGVPVVTACAEKDALGKRCPTSIPPLNLDTINSPAISQFTYPGDGLKSQTFSSPGTYSAAIIVEQPAIITPEVAIKHRSRHKKKRITTDRKEVALSVLNSANGARKLHFKSELGGEKHSGPLEVIEGERENRRIAEKSERRRMRSEEKNVGSENRERSEGSERRKMSEKREKSDMSEKRERSSFRMLEAAPVSWKNDPRKIESLASRFNTGGGNNMMWDQSLDYLSDMRVIDFHEFLQSYAPFERKKCLLNSSVISPKKSGNEGYFNHLVGYVKVALQTSYGPQCGVCACDYKKDRKSVKSVKSEKSVITVIVDQTESNENNERKTERNTVGKVEGKSEGIIVGKSKKDVSQPVELPTLLSRHTGPTDPHSSTVKTEKSETWSDLKYDRYDKPFDLIHEKTVKLEKSEEVLIRSMKRDSDSLLVNTPLHVL